MDHPSRRNPWLVLLSIWLVLSVACNLPGVVRSTSTPQTQNTPVATAVPKPRVSVPLPPTLVETRPVAASQLALNGSLTLFFNQAMEKASVEAAVQLNPSISGKFEWKDASTVVFTPDQKLAPDSKIIVSVGSTAKAANGLAIPAPVDVTFFTAGKMKAVEKLPKPGAADVDPSSAVVVTFDQPVVALGADSSGLAPAFSLKPQSEGRGEWLNTSTYIFYPQPALQGGVQYQVLLDSELISTAGLPLELAEGEQTAWQFTTAMPRLESVLPSTDQTIELNQTFKLSFNQPMDVQSVESALVIKDSAGNPVQGKFTWNDRSSEVEFTSANLLNRNASYTLTFADTARGAGGTPLNQPLTNTYATIGPLAVVKTNPVSGSILETYGGYGSIWATFNTPVKKGDLDSLVTISPAVGELTKFLSEDGYTISMSGYFSNSTEYTVTLSADFQDRWGGNLGQDFVWNVSTDRAAPSLTVPMLMAGGSTLFLPAGEASISAQATNISSVQISSSSLNVTDLIMDIPADQVQRWNAPLNLEPNRNLPIRLPLTENGQPLAAGLYHFELSSPELSANNQKENLKFNLVVSPVQVMLKTSSRQMFVWAVNLNNQTPVSGARVTVYDSLAKVIATGATDEHGIGQIALPEREDLYQNLYAVIAQPGDPNFSMAATNWSQGTSPYEFGIPWGYDDVAQKYYLYSDRPIYRPGQEVYFRGVVRNKENARYPLADTGKVTIIVTGVYSLETNESPTLTTLSLPVSPYGTFNGSFTLPEDASTGYYNMTVKEQASTGLSFQVAEYQKPEIDLQTSLGQADLLAGNDISAEVNAQYYFGAPAGNLKFHWSVSGTEHYFYAPGGYQTGKANTGWLYPMWMNWDSGLGAFVMEGNAVTGPDGTARITLPADVIKDRLDPESTWDLTFEATIMDESNLPVSGRSRATLHPADFYAGIRADAWNVQSGNQASFSIQTMNWEGAPTGNRTLTAKFQKVVYRQEETVDPTVGFARSIPEYTLIASTDFQTDNAGQARVAFTPPEPGTYQLDVSGGGAVSQQIIWVGGEGTAMWPNLPNQHIRLEADASQYRSGDQGKIFIPNPLPGKVLALVTVERNQVMRSQVIEIQGSSYSLDLPLGDEDAPNVFVSVTLLGRNPDGTPEFRQGYVELKVKPEKLTLQVDLAAQPQQAEPGGEVKYSLAVKDSEGNPVQGEFSLALVDKAVLALADANSQGIVKEFYGGSELTVMTSLSLAVYSGRIPALAPGRGGGGGGDMALSPAARQRFEDTAYWNPSIVTDAQGKAEIDVRLPDNLTTWVADLRGLTEDARVGEATRELVVSKNLLVRPVTPRFMVAGDHVKLAALVHNNTGQPIDAEVSLQSSGITLDDAGQSVQQVTIQPGDKQQVSWWATVQAVDAVQLTFGAKGGGFEDFTLPQSGEIPVLHYSAPLTYGTSGMLSEEGEKLEVVSLPRSFQPEGGKLDLELTPSLAATILKGLNALKPSDCRWTECILSYLLPNLETYRTLQELGVDSPDLKSRLETDVNEGVARLAAMQNKDGGWGWVSGKTSNPLISAYVLFGLSRASANGVFVDANRISGAQQYVATQLNEVSDRLLADWELDRKVFYVFVLQQSGQTSELADALIAQRARLSPWAKAFLAISASAEGKKDQAKTLISDLQSSALRSATGAHWEALDPEGQNLATANFTTAVVVLALSREDPASPLLADAVRYLAANRNSSGIWSSTYETAWTLMALTGALKGTGDLQSNYAFSALLNGSPLASGQAAGASTLEPVTSSVPLSGLILDGPNALQIRHDSGSGRLYYRAFLQVDQPVETAEPVQKGISISRNYYLAGQKCRGSECTPLQSVSLSSEDKTLLVRLTITVAETMQYLVVDDHFPAGSEVVNLQLKTSQQGAQEGPSFDAENPFGDGWGWWRFGQPQIYDDHIRWVTDNLPAGTYELTYRLDPLQAGEYRVLPAQAFEHYFPEVQGTSAGSVFRIEE